jgi:hypothetical protein
MIKERTIDDMLMWLVGVAVQIDGSSAAQQAGHSSSKIQQHSLRVCL